MIDNNDFREKYENDYPLKNIYFYLTNECNLRCRHCWVAPKFMSGSHSLSALPLTVFESILEQAKPLGLSCVKLTGGEPLLHPEFGEILKVIRSKELQLTIETNGLLLTPASSREIAECRNPKIAVSLDGVDPETHEWVRGIKGCFDATLRGIKTLVKAGLKPQIIMTIMRRNRDQIEPMVRLAESLGAGSVKFNLVQPTARGEKIHHDNENVGIKELVEIGRMVDGILAKKTALSLFFHWPLAFQSLGNVMGVTQGNGCGICGVQSVLGVLGDGSYSLCGIGENVPDLVFGHAEKDRLADIWHNAEVLSQVRKGLPRRLEGICGVCLMKKRCRGTCVAQNYYRAKSLWAPFWFCEEAFKHGLFPKTRLRPDLEIAKKPSI